MAGNHVEQLESRVRELEATVDGLTDELVDTKDRVETLEGAIAAGEPSDRRSDTVDGQGLGQDEEANTDIAEEAERERGNDTARIVANDGTSGNEGIVESGSEGATEEIEETEETDGIIVA